MSKRIISGCCCGASEHCASCIAGTTPPLVEVTFANVANGTCGDAIALNGTWVLNQVEDCQWILNRGEPGAEGFPCEASELESIQVDVEIYDANMVWKISVFDNDVEIFITYWDSGASDAIDCSDTQTTWTFDQEAGAGDPIDFSSARTGLVLDPQNP